MFVIKKYPEFSWSFSRHKTLMDCERKYGLQYYQSHNGWLYDSDPDSKKAYRLKKLMNIPILFGQIFHEIVEATIKDIFNSGYIPTKEELIKRARVMLNQAFIDSRDNKQFWHNKPNRYKMLFEMYYDGKLDQEVIQDYRERLEIVFENLFYTKSFQDITTRQHTMRFHQSEEFRYMLIDGVKVFVVMDLLYRDIEKGKWIIVDWKTGKESDDDRSQLAVYAYYLMTIFEANLDEIEIRNEYLLTGNKRTYVVNKQEIDVMLHQMRNSVHLMKQYQADILKNEPLPLDQFFKTEYIKKCNKCNFKEICRRT